MEYDYSKGDPIEIPYTQWMFGGNGFLTEKWTTEPWMKST